MNKGRILVVDDEQIVLTAFKIELEQEGYEVKTALSGKEALILVLQEFFDIVYTDLVMPEMNGTQLCREIKRIAPGTEVVLFSGNPYEVQQQQEAFMEAGGRDEMLRKPLGDNVLINVTHNLIKEIRFKKMREQGGSYASQEDTRR